jgi:phospholipid transport system substrate-binding protein
MRDLIDRVGAPPNRRWLLGAMLAAALIRRGAGQAQADPRAAQAQQSVGELYSGLQVVMRMGKAAPFQQRFDQLAPVIDRTFNLEAILRTSVGLRWASLDDTTRRALFSVFRSFTIASYTANFDSNDGMRFEVLPQIRPSGEDLVVGSRLLPRNGDPVRIDYVMHFGQTAPQIVDVLLNGSISKVAVQRSDFRSLLASGSATPLINSLKQKVADLSGGTIRS